MTRYIERGILHDLLVASGDAAALELATLLVDSSAELVTLEPAHAASLLPTYETRLAASAAGIGPTTMGLAAFIEALRGDNVAEVFSVIEGGVVGIGLVAPTGHVIAVTLVRNGTP